MVSLRSVVLALAVLALFVGLASAQVAMGGSTSGSLHCTANMTPSPSRETAAVELVGDILITCTGATSGSTPPILGTQDLFSRVPEGRTNPFAEAFASRIAAVGTVGSDMSGITSTTQRAPGIDVRPNNPLLNIRVAVVYNPATRETTMVRALTSDRGVIITILKVRPRDPPDPLATQDRIRDSALLKGLVPDTTPGPRLITIR